jgi:NAD(P)-dependent dehydrogenase (short-subunit alcohol dehydrogenase family)
MSPSSIKSSQLQLVRSNVARSMSSSTTRVEGFYESLSHELAPFGIFVKTIAPGGMKTDFAGRSMVLAQHSAYSQILAHVMTAFTNPARSERYSTPEQIAEVVYEAVTDGKDQVRYVAGEDAKSSYAQRLQVGSEAFRQAIYHSFVK